MVYGGWKALVVMKPRTYIALDWARLGPNWLDWSYIPFDIKIDRLCILQTKKWSYIPLPYVSFHKYPFPNPLCTENLPKYTKRTESFTARISSHQVNWVGRKLTRRPAGAAGAGARGRAAPGLFRVPLRTR